MHDFRRHARAVATAAIACSFALTGCGGDGGDTTATTTSTTVASTTTTTDPTGPLTLPQSVLQRSDLPAGWTGEPHQGADFVNPCYGDVPSPAEKAYSDDFSHGDFAASSTSAVFAEVAAAHAFFVRVQDPAVLSCLQTTLQRGLAGAAPAGVTVAVALVPFATVAYGDESFALRATVTLTEHAVATPLYIDVLFVRLGRAGFTMQFTAPVAALEASAPNPMALLLLARLHRVPQPVLTPSTTTTTTTASTTTVTSTEPTASTLTGIVGFLTAHGITCTHVDIDNEGPTAAPIGAYNRATCGRDGLPSLELLLYRSAADRDQRRPEMMALPCTTESSLRALDGRAMTVAAGADFDIRAMGSDALTASTLATLNAATEEVARTTGLRATSLTFRCA